MSAPPYLPLFPADYLADTQHLSTEEHGAYLLLLLTAWMQNDCCLPDDDRKLARITGLSLRKWKALRATMLDFWQIEAGRWQNRRLHKERAYAEQKSAINRDKARKRWDQQPAEKKEDGICRGISPGNAPQPQPQPQPQCKEREGSPPFNSPRNSTRSRIDPDWSPTLSENAHNVVDTWPSGMFERELNKFCDHAVDKGRTSQDWDAAFRNWLAKAEDDRGAANDRNRRGDRANEGPRDPFVRASLVRQAERAAQGLELERSKGSIDHYGCAETSPAPRLPLIQAKVEDELFA